MSGLTEAATIKARARGLLRDAHELLGDKTLPKMVKDAIEGLRAALKKTWADLEADAEGEAVQEAKKTEDGQEFPASDYAYVPDPDKPSTWKLRLTSTPGGEPDARIVGAAVAALGKGFRGQKVDIPEEDLPKVKAKVRAAWRKANPDKSDDDMPAVLREAGDWSHDEIHSMLQRAVDVRRQVAPTVSTIWVQDVHDDWFVYQDDATGKLYRRSYAIDEKGTVTLGEPEEVVAQRVYVPASEAAILESGFVPLVEKAVRADGTIPVKIIQPGWGSSGYYSPDVLKRDGSKVFTKGLKMYWNHPTPTEEAERPERDLRDLAATLVTDARYEEKGPAGPGLYADAQVFGPYREAVNELAPHIGVSIRALGRAKQGEADGRQGPIVDEIVAAKSVDFVTTPGAGGQILQLFEAARHGALPLSNTGGDEVTEQEAQELRSRLAALEAENARLKEAVILRDAKAFVGEVLAGIEMPAMTRARLTESLSAKPVVKDGVLDRPVYKAQIEEAARVELAYLAEVGGSGRITGMGGAPAPDGDVKKRLAEAFKRAGLSDEQAAIAAAGR